MKDPMDDLSSEEKELLGKHGASLGALRTRHADCPGLEVLLALQSGVLPEETARSVAKHLEKCGFCQILLKDASGEELLAATVEEERRVGERVLAGTKPGMKSAKAGGGFFSMWFWKAIPITALAAIVIAAIVWVRYHQPAAPGQPPTTVAQQPVTSATSSVLEWEKLPIKLQASSILVVRGAPRTDQEKYATGLTSGLAYYRDDNFVEAEKRLAGVAKDFPRGVEARLYMGVAQLKLKENTEAIAALSAAQKLGAEQFRGDATWYLALAYHGAGETEQAVAELQKLCQGKSGYSERACTGIQELSVPPTEKRQR